MDDRIELLAPAGDYDAFLAAVENGADAVYLGGRLFNARQLAPNFDAGQLKKALDYAHVRGVKVYLAMNTLVADSEMGQAVEQAGEAYLMGADGIIVQDLGFAGVLRRLFPGLDLHGSTQMTVYNLEGVRVLEQLGFKRVVLARELPMTEIGHIAKNTDLEVEIFVHGALCISYSGQCLLSSIIGGRSGNRGKCAQPCRLPYELLASEGGKRLGRGYLLSPRDICTIEILKDILGSGARALKIEGRMKSPEYVATVVRVYRKYIDCLMGSEIEGPGGVDRQDLRDLAQAFNRGGFSRGYFHGRTGSDMMCWEKPKNWGVYLGEVLSYDQASKMLKIRLEDELSIGDGIEVWNGQEESPGNIVTEIRVGGKNTATASRGETILAGALSGTISAGNRVYKTSDKGLNAAARETFQGRGRRKAAIEGEITVKAGLPVTLVVRDDKGNEVRVAGGQLPEGAVNRPLTREKVLEQMGKTGATPFEFRKMDIFLEEGLAVPASELNDIRRRALEALEMKRADFHVREMSDDMAEKKESLLYFPGNSRNPAGKLNISAFFYSVDEGVDFRQLNINRVYLPFSLFLGERGGRIAALCRERGCEVFIWLPSITRGNYHHLIQSRLGNIVEGGADGLLIGSLGSLAYAGELSGLKLMGDYSLNVLNSFSAGEIVKLNLCGITLSPELTLAQIGAMRDFPGLQKEAVVYGRIAVMTSEYCPAGCVAGGFTAKTKCSGACGKGDYRLKDRMGMEFPVVCDKIDCRSTVFNSNVLFVPDALERIKRAGVDTVRLIITDESPGEIKELAELHRDVAAHGMEGAERHMALVEKIKAKGFTKGHYFRGV